MKTLKQTLSLSLPVKEVKHLKSSYKKRGFDSISSYISYLINSDTPDENVISREELLESIKEADKEYEEGRTIVLKSASELYDYL